MKLKQIIKNINKIFGLLVILIMAPIVFIICCPPLSNLLTFPWSKSYVETSSKISDIGVYIGLGLCAAILIAWPFYLIKLKYKKRNRKEILDDSDKENTRISPANKKIINMLENLNSIIEKEMKEDKH